MSKRVNGTFKWLAGMLAVGCLGSGGWFVTNHVAGDTRQWTAIHENERSVAGLSAKAEAVDRRLSELIERQQAWQGRCDEKLDRLLERSVGG